MKVIEKVRSTARKLQTIVRRRPQSPQPPKVMQARVRASVPATANDLDDDEPQTKLTSAFIVVLILHVITVGGIYAFNQLKTSHRPIDPPAASTTAPETRTTTARPAQPAPAPAPASVAEEAPAPRPRTYTVKQGDTLGGLARTYGLSVAELKSLNGLTSDSIRLGQVLTFSPTTRPAEPAPKPAAESRPTTRTYTVKQGDRLIFIAKKFNVTPEDLIALNKIKDPSRLQVGQTLKVPVKK